MEMQEGRIRKLSAAFEPENGHVTSQKSCACIACPEASNHIRRQGAQGRGSYVNHLMFCLAGAHAAPVRKDVRAKTRGVGRQKRGDSPKERGDHTLLDQANVNPPLKRVLATAALHSSSNSPSAHLHYYGSCVYDPCVDHVTITEAQQLPITIQSRTML
jgi:hypothetical protein